MKLNPYPSFVLLLFFLVKTTISYTQSLQISDTLNVQWTRQEGPSAYVSSYAEGNGVIYAASEEALFSSTDAGLHWEYNLALGRKRIKRLFANDHSLIVITEEPKKIADNDPHFSVDLHQVLHSTDGGQSWKEVLSFIQEPEAFSPNQTFEISVANDSTLIFNYLFFPTLTEGIIQTWISSNYGTSWTQTINNAGLLHASHDTVSYIYAGTNILVGKVSSINDLANPQTVDLSATGSIWANLVKAFYQNGVFYLFQNDKTLWRSADLGSTWLTDLLPFSGDFKDVIWADSAFYILSTDGVYEASHSNPTTLIKIYDGQQSFIKEAKTFTPLSSGYWLNNNLNQTIFSFNAGQSWEAKFKGLSSKIGSISSICNQLIARSAGAQYDKGGWYIADPQDQNWMLQTDPFYYQFSNYLELYLGEIDGFAYRYKPVLVQRSSNCGQTWENLNPTVTALPKGIIKHQNRLFLYTSFDLYFQYSDDNGVSWLEGALPDYSIINLISVGTSLVAFYNNTSFVSNDLGVSWQERPLPLGTEQMFVNDQKLIAYDGPSYSDTTHIHQSIDVGLNWSIAQVIAPPIGGLSDLIYHDSSVLLLHHNFALYMSTDGGESWALMQMSPFTKRVTPSFNSNWNGFDSLVPQASRYLINKGNLYAATEADGLWSTPMDSIFQNLNPSSAFKDIISPTRKHFKIQPNPVKAETWVIASETIDSEGTIHLLDTSGRIWRTWKNVEFSKVGFKLELENLPNGFYFVELVGAGFVETHRIIKI